ncbi:SDR family oxidoreductase [Sphingomonas sp. TREG-RG-20F-R18-01]|uniref:SDR family oxidoreductase n=1 Tax=Sphingomonas sp. TREG-RG-20F-R18-01 TaxID=2914982 RepID=UPI001F58FD5F|nr:SDR family oxidoreductase [Sphingomonas sp. TREG-RG-20F-R18-01]
MKILLTGAAGLLGGEVAARLVGEGHRVTGLVNRNREVRANDGIPVADITLLAGDLAAERLGWDDATWNGVAENQDLVVHCAAITQFDAPEALHRAVNVEGTARIVDLARAGGMKLVHISTAYVCGMRNGPVMEEARDVRFPFANGYEVSKAAAEALVRESGVPAVIARPSVIVGEWASGAIRQFDTIYAAFKLIAQGRVRIMPATTEATIDFVPIDHVAGSIVNLVEHIDAAVGSTCHLVSGAPVPIETFRAAIARIPHFATPEFVNPIDFDPTTLPPLERRLHTRVTGLYSSYFQRDPRFDDTQARALTGRKCSPADGAFLNRLIDYAIGTGFLPSEQGETKARATP